MTVLSRLTAALVERYRIERELGAGGMATVYLAHDLKHERDVAIKVLHPDLGAALGADRFLAEIKTTAKLQHPHILPLLDSGAADGLLYYVMPLVTGETLRARLERDRQLGLEEALLIAREVADALQHAHTLGVLHRDIKPENILLQNGHALVADFGIALAVQTAGGARMTQTGLSLGTPQYMSPEQAMGEKSVDARSDIYALGAVTYEMLVGEPPFTGPSVQAIVARILTEEPRSVAMQRKAVPDTVDHAIMRALEKLPADRFPNAAEFVAALRGDVASRAPKSPRGRAKRTAPLWALAVVGVAMLAAGAAITETLRKPASVSAPVRKLTIALPDSMRVAFKGSGNRAGGQGSVAISADGRRIAWVGTAGRGSADVRLYVRDMDSYSISAVPGSAGGYAPMLSHDGSRLAYFSGGELRETILANGETRVVARDVSAAVGGGYLSDGSILLATEASAMTLITPDGATRRIESVATAGNKSPGSVDFPRAFAGDRYAVGLATGGPMVVIALADGAVRWVRPFPGDTATQVIGSAPKVAGGRLYWLERDVVLSAQFDAGRAQLTSAPMVTVTGVRGDVLGAADFDVAEDGTVVFVPGADASVGPLAWLDSQGHVDTLPLPPANYVGFDISPDSRSLLTKSITSAGVMEIRLVDLAQGLSTPLEVGTGDISQPGWLADGRSLLVSVGPRGVGSSRVLRFATDRRSAPDTIMPGGLDRYSASRNGRVVALQISTTRSPNRYLGAERWIRNSTPVGTTAPSRNCCRSVVWRCPHFRRTATG